MAERVGRVVGGQLVVVQAVRAAPAGHDAAAGLEVQAHLAGDELLARLDERVERLLERREPQAVVDELRVAGLDARLLPLEVALEADRLEVLVGEDEGEAGRALVGLAALDADPTVLDHVDATPAVGADDVVERIDHLEHAEPAAVDLDRTALLEADDDVARLGGRLLRQRPHATRRHRPRVLHLAALDGTAPEVVVDGVHLLLRRLDRDVVAVGVEDRLLAGHPPAPHRGDHLEVGRERTGRHLEAHLVVALARAAVGDGVGALGSRGGDEVLDDDRSRQRGHQRVAALVERVRGERRRDVLLGELLAGVDDHRVARAPAASARSWTTSQSSDACPTSTASAMTSTPSSSIIQRTATEVSRPPL